MQTKRNLQQVNLCGKKLNGLRHVCGFFDSRDEQYEILAPYLKEGIDQGERVLTILESDGHEDHKQRLASAGIPVAEACEKEQLQILASEETYLKGGAFVVEEMYGLLKDALEEAERSDFRRIRTAGDMAWALKNCPGTEDLMEYEARVNQLASSHDCTLLCAYDINKFSGRVLADVLATHSHVVLGGRVHANAHYVNPLEYLQKTALRRRSYPIARDPS